jgi:uncharacterized protein YjbI with pentapeptide repeats
MADNFDETRDSMKNLVQEAKPVLNKEFDELLLEHDMFLQNGGAGGHWATFYIKNLIFGVYKGINTEDIKTGKQAKLCFKNLQEVNLAEIRLPYADCAAVYAIKKDWNGADLEGSLFIDSILNDCNFDQADLYATDFSRSQMRNCSFRGANLVNTDFEDCDLTGADFRGAKIDPSTSFKNAILKDAKMDK